MPAFFVAHTCSILRKDQGGLAIVGDALAKLRALKVQHFPGWKRPEH